MFFVIVVWHQVTWSINYYGSLHSFHLCLFSCLRFIHMYSIWNLESLAVPHSSLFICSVLFCSVLFALRWSTPIHPLVNSVAVSFIFEMLFDQIYSVPFSTLENGFYLSEHLECTGKLLGDSKKQMRWKNPRWIIFIEYKVINDNVS